MTISSTKEGIKSSLAAFDNKNLANSALSLFETLGYKSSKRLPLKPNSPENFLTTFVGSHTFNKESALFAEWQSIDFIFQLTDDEINAALNSPKKLFSSEGVYNGAAINSYLFFALDLKDTSYSRTALANITRSINKLFPMPGLILFRHGETLTLSIINRRLHKKDGSKDVLEKVTLIKDICFAQPHRAHLEILFDLSFSKLCEESPVSNFVDLQNAWQKVLDTKELNKRFYCELSNWYFWAIKHVTFPKTHFKDSKSSKDKAENVIRMLTRLLFVWFLKEKKLIPNELFDLTILSNKFIKKGLLFPEADKDKLFSDSHNKSVYYKAILQNLFFATLNCPISPEKDDDRKRGFRKLKTYGQNRGVDYLMRYEEYFQDPEAFVAMLNKVVPFLNGGLFECLDDKDNNLYVDGFSDGMTQGNTLIVPDFLFFGTGTSIDLSEDYGIETQATTNVAVKGLINILKSYKFTVAENTPIEEDVALDPELLGRVFENLLASYNPETKTSARKQTGSFYTPREIVNYMIEEALIAFLKTRIDSWGDLDENEVDEQLRLLTSFSEVLPFKNNLELQKKIIHAISRCTIIDPACGSGAFPMGALQKMVHILQKLDPENKIWKEVQVSKATEDAEEAFNIENNQARAIRLSEISEAFDRSINDPDYARKLFLIENCIYGVDIQPVATHISKLRFFISLVAEQKPDPTKPNFGILPLPNLETKFVTANTLVGIEKPDQCRSLFDTKEIKELEEQLKQTRSKIFSARTKDTKQKYRKKDKELRESIASELIASGWHHDTAQKLACWDPYDQNASSPFFDTEWMFDVKDGFDIVIGNPPFVDSETMVRNDPVFRDLLREKYKTAKGNWDLFVVFVERGVLLTKQNGLTTYIIPNKFISAKYTCDLREFLCDYQVNELSDYSAVNVFENADVYPVVIRVSNSPTKSTVKTRLMVTLCDAKLQLLVDPTIFYKDIFWDKFFFEKETTLALMEMSKYKPLKEYDFDICGAATVKEAYQIKDKIQELNNSIIDYFKLINTGTIDPFINHWGLRNTQYIKGAYVKPVIANNDLNKISVKRASQAKSAKIIIAGMTKTIEAYFDFGGILAGKSTSIILGDIKKLMALNVLLNSSLLSFWFSKNYNSLSMSGGYFNVGIHELGSLPIPDQLFSKYLETFSRLNSIIEFVYSYSFNPDFFVSLLNSACFELFFPVRVQNSNSEILKHMADLPVLKNDWSNETKLRAIQNFYSVCSSSSHPISMAIKQQASLSEMRIIMGLAVLNDNKTK